MKNTIAIGRKFNPSTILKTDIKNKTEIKVSYGGGMGGANESHYGEIILEDETFIVLKNLDDIDIKLGKNFIVSIQEKLLATIVTDTTDSSSNGRKAKKQIHTQITIHNLNDDISFTDDYYKKTSCNLLNVLVSQSEDIK